MRGERLIELITIAALLAGFYVAWTIGANDTSNCIGAAVGGRVLSYRMGVAIVILFAVLGAVLEGWKNMGTVGEGIVVGSGGVNPLSNAPLVIIAALLAAGTWLTISTTMGLPVSTSQSMVGAVVGAGLLLSYVQVGGVSASIQLGTIGTIAISWVLNPMFAALLAFAISKAMAPLLRRIKNIILLNRVLIILIVVASAATAYANGANDVGTSTGVIYAFFRGSTDNSLKILIGLFGGIGLTVGVLTYSRKVLHTVSAGITKLDALSAFAAQMGAAITVLSFVQLRIPVSITQAIVGAIVGAGLVKGVAAVNRRKLGRIGIAWAIGPVITCVLSIVLGWLLLRL